MTNLFVLAAIAALVAAGIWLVRTRQALHDCRTAFDALTAKAPIGIMVADEAGFCTFANDVWYELSGLDPGAALGHSWSRSIHPDDVPTVMQRWDERLERRKSREKGGDVTAALPGATAPAEPLKSVVVIPGVAVQVQPPVPKSAKRPAPRKAPAPAATAPVIPGLTPAASAASESVPAPLDAAGVVAAVLEEGSDRAKAYALMLRKGSLPLEKAVALAKAEGLL